MEWSQRLGNSEGRSDGVELQRKHRGRGIRSKHPSVCLFVSFILGLHEQWTQEDSWQVVVWMGVLLKIWNTYPQALSAHIDTFDSRWPKCQSMCIYISLRVRTGPSLQCAHVLFHHSLPHGLHPPLCDLIHVRLVGDSRNNRGSRLVTCRHSNALHSEVSKSNGRALLEHCHISA